MVLHILAGSEHYQLTCFFYQEGCDLSHFQSFINKKSILRRINFISKWPLLKNWKPLFYRISIRILFLISKLILEGSYAFVLFLQWIYILTDSRNLQNEHFGGNCSNFGLKMVLEARNFASSLTLNFINLSWFSCMTAVICHMFKVLSSKRVF